MKTDQQQKQARSQNTEPREALPADRRLRPVSEQNRESRWLAAPLWTTEGKHIR